MLCKVNGIHAQQSTRHYNRSIAFQLPSPLNATHLDISHSSPSYSTPISPPSTTHAGYWAIQPGHWSSLLGIPHYLTIIKHLMDSSMIDVRLAVSNPSKPDPNHSVTQYLSIQEFITWSSCLTTITSSMGLTMSSFNVLGSFKPCLNGLWEICHLPRW